MTDPATLAAWDQRYLWHPFTQMADWLAEEPLVIAEAEGCTLVDTRGRRYLDGVSSLWCNVHGHRHPALDAALRDQLARVAHSTLLGLASVPSIELARALIEIAPPGLTRVFYSDAGATAVEAALRIADEVATGFGRTGRMFACEHAGITPDLMCLAKGLSGGYLPLAATLATEEVFAGFLGPYEEFRAFFHGHTYTGNPLGCAVALASLRLFHEERTLERLGPKIARLRERLAADIAPLAHVGDVRQQGVMVGIELVAERAGRVPYPPAARIGQRVVRAARARGVILRPLGNVIVLMPALAIAPAELERLVDVAREAIQEVTGA